MSQNTFQLADKERIFDLLAEIGTPIFDTGDRYLLMLESLDGKTNVEMTYYKETLKSSINFI